MNKLTLGGVFMKLKVLIDNNTYIDQYYFGEPGLSFLLETDKEKILFDTGYSGIYLTNAELMHIDLSDITHLVISHGHSDHTGGIAHLLDFEYKDVQFIAHPNCFDKKRKHGTEIGSYLQPEDLKPFFSLHLTKEPYWINDRLVFLGEIPTVFDFERVPVGEKWENGKWIPDINVDDSALAYKTDKGLFIITACSHSGICNIAEYAKKVCNDERICGIIGGFHLLKDDEKLHKTVEYLARQNTPALYPAHCVCLVAKIALSKQLNIKEVATNFELTID